MAPELNRFLSEMKDWIRAVRNLRPSVESACEHVEAAIEADLRCLGSGVPFRGILQGYPLPSVTGQASPAEGEGVDFGQACEPAPE
ncbi:MAG: hypothetical protein RLZZ179_2687 [Verrucomicrobiota bacterium]|jgi:hypothetical protein